MKLQAAAPESFVSERIESKCLSSLLHELARIPLNDAIDIAVPPAGVPTLTHDCKRQSADAHNCRDQEYFRHAFHILHNLPPKATEWPARIPLRFSGKENFWVSCNLLECRDSV